MQSSFKRASRSAPFGLALVVLAAGCGYPVAEPMNMELISSLRTALSVRSEPWLKANEDIVEQRHVAGQLRDDEYAAFRGIIDKARSGDWQAAELASVKFQRAQRPTAEQVRQIREQRQGPARPEPG